MKIAENILEINGSSYCFSSPYRSYAKKLAVYLRKISLLIQKPWV